MSKPRTPFENDAFISYNNADAEFARKLEHELEHYRPPGDISGQSGHLSIFRYEGDMVGTDYDLAIKEQLENSRLLIVICSPEARASNFVDDEVRVFSKLRGVENIIPVMLRGKADNTTENESEKAFPRALTEQVRMPLGINFLGFESKKNKFKTGQYESSWFSLLANIYGVSRDEIEQRIRARRLRRRTLWSIGSSMVTAVVLVMAIFAWFQRGEALQSQALAEAQLLAMKAERRVLAHQPEEALILASASIRRVDSYPEIRVSPDAVSVIYQSLPEFEGIGLAGWHASWPRQRDTSPWVVTEQSGRWLMTGNFGGNTALLWDLNNDPIAGSARVLTDVPDNYHKGRWEDNIQNYALNSMPDIAGPWIASPWDYGALLDDLPADNEIGKAVQRLANPEWVIRQKSDRSYWLSFESESKSRLIPLAYDISEPQGQLTVTADHQWLVVPGARTHRLIRLADADPEVHYSSHINFVQWANNGQVLYTAHRQDGVYRWPSSGPAEHLALGSNPRSVIELVVSENENWLMVRHGAGDWSVWEHSNDTWVARLSANDDGYHDFSKALMYSHYHMHNRLAASEGLPYDYGQKGSADMHISDDGILSANQAVGPVQWDLSRFPEVLTTLNQETFEQLSANRPEGRVVSGSLTSQATWSATGSGLYKLPEANSAEGKKAYSQEWPSLGGGIYPSVFLFGPDKRWLVIGAMYQGRENSCEIPLSFYRVDLSHPSPVDTWIPLGGNPILARTSGPNNVSNSLGEYEFTLKDCPIVEFSDQGNWLLAEDAIWPTTGDTSSADRITLPGPGISINPQETMVAVQFANAKGLRIELLPLEPEAIAKLACRVAGRNLIDEEWRLLFPGQVYTPLCPENSRPADLTVGKTHD